MRLYLIRHGETCDNVAGLYAGVRDSALTNHGVDQINRLGEHIARTGVKLTHIYTSPLQRAHKTAEAILKAQDPRKAGLEITKVHELIEQDFGFYEGKPFYARREGSSKTGREAHHEKHKSDPDFVDVEDRESMAKRCDAFLDGHLIPLFIPREGMERHAVAIVSHGILLANLWRRLLLRIPKKSLVIAPEITTARGPVVLEHLGGWSNTGYLELSFRKVNDSEAHAANSIRTERVLASALDEEGVPGPLEGEGEAVVDAAEGLDVTDRCDTASGKKVTKATENLELVRRIESYAVSIIAIDSKVHLVGLKRQRGGIGNLRHDEGQTKLDGFFKRRKLG